MEMESQSYSLTVNRSGIEKRNCIEGVSARVAHLKHREAKQSDRHVNMGRETGGRAGEQTGGGGGGGKGKVHCLPCHG